MLARGRCGVGTAPADNVAMGRGREGVESQVLPAGVEQQAEREDPA